jgi:predicted DNA-binding transcriptional regulator AlpA
MYQRLESLTQSPASLSQSTGEIWGLGEIASYLGISIGATRRLVSHPKFPHPLANQSRNRRWIKSEVMNYLMARSKGEIKDSAQLPPNPHYVPKTIHIRQLKAVNS